MKIPLAVRAVRSPATLALCAVSALTLFTSQPAAAQGRTDYLNVETPQVRPITVARLQGHDYLLVCNTPDNSLEVYDTDETLPAQSRFLARIPVGLEPNSVLYDPSRSRFWVSNFLGDSITTGVLTATSGPASLTFTLDASRNVGDEPMDMALTPDGSTLLVTFHAKNTLGAFHPIKLTPIPANAAFPAPTDDLELTATFGSQERIVKEPRRILVQGSQAFVLGHKGGITTPNQQVNPTGYDFDVYARDVTTGAVNTVVGLGSTNWGMRFGGNGDLYVVGGVAQSHLIGGAVASAPSGFVTSQVFRVTGAGTGSPVVLTRDLNLVSGNPVSKPDALAMPTDVEVFVGGIGTTKLFITAFGSDRLGIVTLVDPADPSTWTIVRRAVPVAPGSTNPRSGPRALATKPALGGFGSPGARIYVLNRLDNSVSIFDPTNDNFIETFALQNDPTPAYIRDGRQFLFSADFSLSGFNSCASCHTDGRTDAIGWNLGSPTGFSAPFSRGFVDSPSGASIADLIALLNNGFDPDKGRLVTQTFQGLLDHELPPDLQDLTTNAPYHWRGDRATFLDFNEGFANLLALGDNFGGGQPGDLPMGISLAEMEAMEEYVNSIHYPPNFQQDESRVYSGTFDESTPNDTTTGSDALRGMKIFHMLRLPNSVGGGRSCVQCHALGPGSNLDYTDSFFLFQGAPPQPLESAQIRGLVQRERLHQVDGDDLSTTTSSGMFGLTHGGGRISINEFNNIFAPSMTLEQRKDLNRFVHEFDTGLAPMIGQEQVITPATASPSGPEAARIADFENQAKVANVGVSVQGWVASTQVGYWYDAAIDRYVVESSAGGSSVDLATLLATVTGSRDRLFFRCTPLGTERRLASLSGSSTPFTGATTPSSLTLLPMATNTAWAQVPLMSGNWIPQSLGGDFVWSHATDPTMPTPRFSRAVRQLQHGLIDPGNTENYGFTALRHEAPRRFRISGDGILPGAKLVIWTPDDSSPPNTTQIPPDPAKTRRLEFPLYATGQTDQGRPVWETAVELAPIRYLSLMNGGPEMPGVASILGDVLSQLGEPSGALDPDSFNWHFIEVINPNGQTGSATAWQRLKL